MPDLEWEFDTNLKFGLVLLNECCDSKFFPHDTTRQAQSATPSMTSCTPVPASSYCYTQTPFYTQNLFTNTSTPMEVQ